MNGIGVHSDTIRKFNGQTKFERRGSSSSPKMLLISVPESSPVQYKEMATGNSETDSRLGLSFPKFWFFSWIRYHNGSALQK